jgi:PAS domain S-box-containing protein
MKKNEKSEAENLHQKAEELLKKKPRKTALPLSEIDTLKLIHDLEVHQVELELQNIELRHAKTSAEVATSKYTNLYEYAPSGYFTLSTVGKIIEINLTGTILLGKERSKLINSRFTNFVSPDTRTVFNVFLEKIFQTKCKENCEVKLLANGDNPTYVLLTGIITENAEQCNVTMVDISERKRAEEALHKSELAFRLLAESMPQIVWITDPAGLNIYFNQQWVDYTGLTLEESYGDGWNKPFHPDDQLRAWNAWQNATKHGATYSLECRLRRADGKYTWWLVRGVPVFDSKGAVIKWFGTCTDIEELKRSEAELIIAKEHAEESDHLKSAFLANMSHEIRTPMNGILGFASLLKEPNLTGEEQQKYIRIIEKSGARMLNIINDIVDISKIEAGLMEVNLKESNINDQIENIFNFFIPEVERKRIQLSFKTTLPAKDAVIATDREKIYSILTNLVKNSIKYTFEGSIEFGYEKKGEYLEFFVKDTGIGIAKNRQEAIFERFVQADIEDPKALQGAGLGLSITKAYVEMLGGVIWVKSVEGIGSTFYFTIPFITEKQTQSNITKVVSAEDKEVQINNLKLLLVEDDETSDFLITTMLKKNNHEVLHVKTGIEAIEACRNNPDIDLVLMDIRMPNINGYEATRQIRQFNKDVIIIAQTAYGLSGDRQKAIDSGCNEYLSKPIDKDDLLRFMQKYFKS